MRQDLREGTAGQHVDCALTRRLSATEAVASFRGYGPPPPMRNRGSGPDARQALRDRRSVEVGGSAASESSARHGHLRGVRATCSTFVANTATAIHPLGQEVLYNGIARSPGAR